mmetsp:Transcript_19547/g.29286  ORF Transcript_19547/g.29286 Transcript_19547/m.29286 type:complete len:452 (-) Transcript_19547:86-1441(-)
MAPQIISTSTEHTPLVDKEKQQQNAALELDENDEEFKTSSSIMLTALLLVFLGGLICYSVKHFSIPSNDIPVIPTNTASVTEEPTGKYKLVEKQEDMDFFDYYTFYDGPDSLGSAGYNTYVSKEEAERLDIVGVDKDPTTKEEFVFMKSSPTTEGPRSSIRLEGKTRFDRGLFILDLRHMPSGAGVWPAFWLTDEQNWPNNGEIDIVEGINNQSVAKTALHTSEDCDMFAHVPDYAKTGTWEWNTGLPDTFTGIPDFKTVKEADNCWEWAPHQWFNSGCVQVSSEKGSLGQPLNAKGGGIFALEWDPANFYIRSWVFSPHTDAPQNVLDVISTSNSTDEADKVLPDTQLWGLPYAYFAIGDGTGCSADHFKNIRLVFNIAFCGTVAGNRFFGDQPTEAKMFNVNNDPIATCDAYIKSDPDALNEAYWKIKGLYVYEREMVTKTEDSTTPVN